MKLSYSALETYDRSQLEYYFRYVKKLLPKPTKISPYGDAGNVVHKVLERMIQDCKKDQGKALHEYHYYFNDAWDSAELPENIPADDYWNCILEGFKVIQGATAFDRTYPEKRLEYKIPNIDVTIVGIVDVLNMHIDANNATIPTLLIDWKTNSQAGSTTHLNQRIFYSWLVWKIYGVIPKCQWHYLKLKRIIDDEIDENTLINFETTLMTKVQEILSKGDDISLFEPGGWDNIFNGYRDECESIVKEGELLKIRIIGGRCFIEGKIPETLQKGLTHFNKYDLPDKYFRQERVRAKNPMRDVSKVGTVFLYNEYTRSFSIGLLDKVKRIIDDYNIHHNPVVKYILKDERDPKIMGYKNEKLIFQTPKIKLRDYQEEAVESFCKKGMGVLQLPTRTGKTVIASEIIRRLNTTTLWITDTKALFDQSKRSIEQYLGVEIGSCIDGSMDFKEVTIATIDTLMQLYKKRLLGEVLANVNLVVVDEWHHGAAKSFVTILDLLRNSKYRLGLSATPERTDGNTPLLYSLINEVVYKVEEKDMIARGYLVQPKIIFIELKTGEQGDSYDEDYKSSVVKNTIRQIRLEDIISHNDGKKILILTKLVPHGRSIAKKLGTPFIHGKLDDEERKNILENFKNGRGGILVMTDKIGREGLDIPDLEVVINCAANKNDVSSIQTLGRVLTNDGSKEFGAYYDFVDVGKYTYDHSVKRIQAFEAKGYVVKVIDGLDLREGSS